ncbi:hypothetical protein CUMW_129770 [Citrus unshiu]|nr:hypothetical protein CUMW_129770 [Citrus unshiu]
MTCVPNIDRGGEKGSKREAALWKMRKKGKKLTAKENDVVVQFSNYDKRFTSLCLNRRAPRLQLNRRAPRRACVINQF